MFRSYIAVLAFCFSVLPVAGTFGCVPESLRPSPEWVSLKEEIRSEFPRVQQLSVEELERRLESGSAPLLVDVRPPHEYAVSHLPGAINASGEELGRLLASEQGGRAVVLYCSVGYRSSAEASRLIDGGVDNVFNLEGSIFEWANSGRPVYRGSQRIDEVHPYDETWGKLLEPSLRSYGND